VFEVCGVARCQLVGQGPANCSRCCPVWWSSDCLGCLVGAVIALDDRPQPLKVGDHVADSVLELGGPGCARTGELFGRVGRRYPGIKQVQPATLQVLAGAVAARAAVGVAVDSGVGAWQGLSGGRSAGAGWVIAVSSGVSGIGLPLRNKRARPVQDICAVHACP
jgi:hypothetical protein